MNINSQMMESTCKIAGRNSVGSGFILGRAFPNDSGRARYTLITAQHVLAGIQDENAVLTLRRRKSADQWERVDAPIRIRDAGEDLWIKHADVDLAAMYVALPDGVLKDSLLPTTLLLTDDALREFEIGPGAELLCLGYPLGAEANTLGFPILRSGKVASFPLLPTKEMKTFLFDFQVFKGNSGGPVYLYHTNPFYGGTTHIGSIQGIIGVVSNEQNVTQKTEMLFESREIRTPLSLGGVIPSSFICELLEKLPDPSIP